MIPALSLVVAILAVFFGPLVAWSVAHQQMIVTAREVWMREFRQQVATILSTYWRFLAHTEKHTWDQPEEARRLAAINDDMRSPYYAISFLIAEHGNQHTAFIRTLARLMQANKDEAPHHLKQVADAAEAILQQERAAIAATSVWSALRNSLGIAI